MREKYMEQKLVREVKKLGGLCEKWNSGSSGRPDRHNQLRALGYKVFVLDDLGQIGGIIDAIQTA